MGRTFFKNILTQSSRRRGEEPKVERGVITKFCDFYMPFYIFIMKINMEEESDYLITYSPLRPLRLCVKKFK
jgi:hypothetical protein